jgi:hypothetical protein
MMPCVLLFLQALLTAQLAAKDQEVAAIKETYNKAYRQHNSQVSRT